MRYSALNSHEQFANPSAKTGTSARLSVRFIRAAVDSAFEFRLDIVFVYGDWWNGRHSHRFVSWSVDQGKDTFRTYTFHLRSFGRGMRGSVSAGLDNHSAVDGWSRLGRCRILVRWSLDRSIPDRPILRGTRRIEFQFEPSVHSPVWSLVSELSNPA